VRNPNHAAVATSARRHDTAMPETAFCKCCIVSASLEEFAMAKPNYQYEKRQRELEKKKKKAEKDQRKSQAKEEAVPPAEDSTPAETPTP
jgi:hypothetical protein